jgi:hypothetical protein
MIRRSLVAAGLLALGACASNPRPGSAANEGLVLKAGEKYVAVVDNRSACTAKVRFGQTANSSGITLGSVWARGKDSFQFTAPTSGRVTAVALEPDGHACDGHLFNEVHVTVTEQS